MYNNITSTFEDLLELDESVTIHHRNLRTLAIEMYKVAKGIALKILSDLFKVK